jgi:hypothetical protein
VSLTRADIGIWLISLPRDAARRDRLTAQLAAVGLTPHWPDAALVSRH